MSRTWGLESCRSECQSSLLLTRLVILGKAPHLSKLHFPPLIRRGMVFVALVLLTLVLCGEVLLLVGREDVRHNPGHMAGSQQTGFSRTASGTPASLVQIPSAQMRPS